MFVIRVPCDTPHLRKKLHSLTVTWKTGVPIENKKNALQRYFRMCLCLSSLARIYFWNSSRGILMIKVYRCVATTIPVYGGGLQWTVVSWREGESCFKERERNTSKGGGLHAPKTDCTKRPHLLRSFIKGITLGLVCSSVSGTWQVTFCLYLIRSLIPLRWCTSPACSACRGGVWRWWAAFLASGNDSRELCT